MTAPPLDGRTTDGDNLLAAILADPADDAPRVAYADWLDERGGPGDRERAEFVRVQIEIALLESKAGGQHAASNHTHCDKCGRLHYVLRARERELEGRHQHEWVADLAPLFGVGRWEFRRGFVAEVRCTAAAFVGGGECGRCLTTGNDSDPNLGKPCTLCSGTGRTPGLAAALAGRQPVLAVTLSDRHPYQHPTGSPWRWHGSGDRDDPTTFDVSRPDAIPWVLRRLMAPGRETASFDSEMEARNALNSASVEYARKLAGLPSLVGAKRVK